MASAGFPPPVVDRLHQMYSYIAEHGCAGDSGAHSVLYSGLCLLRWSCSRSASSPLVCSTAMCKTPRVLSGGLRPDPCMSVAATLRMQLDEKQTAPRRRYFDPERDMALVRQINPHPQTWADFVRLTGFDGSQSLDDVRARFAC